MAVIKCEGVWDCQPLISDSLFEDDTNLVEKENKFIVIGYYWDSQQKEMTFTPSIEGEFLDYHQISAQTGVHANRYSLKTSDDQKDKGTNLAEGHSGSPVFNKDQTDVIGVFLQLKNEQGNQYFRIISIDALNKFWNGLSRYKSTKLPTNFLKLGNLLAQGKWKDANEETIELMLTIADRHEQKFLDENDINNFPPKDLQMIDSLWRKYSKDRFGMFIQSEIYFQQGYGKIIENKSYIGGLIEKFCDEVGWRQNRKYQEYYELTFDINTPKGHLPHLGKRISEQEDKERPGIKGEFIYTYSLQYLYLRFTKFKLEEYQQKEKETAKISEENQRLKEELENLRQKEDRN